MLVLLKQYEPANIYNADEKTLYFRALPDSTYVAKSTCNDVRGIKVAKDCGKDTGMLQHEWRQTSFTRYRFISKPAML